jgi:hypothetical protein
MDILRRILATSALAGLTPGILPVAVALPAAAATSQTLTLDGRYSSWTFHPIAFHLRYSFPGLAWHDTSREFIVLTADMNNTGRRAGRMVGMPSTARASVLQTIPDVIFAFKVLPNFATRYPQGWSNVGRDTYYDKMTLEATKLYGGVVPWSLTKPGHTTRYTIVFNVAREKHYGFYQWVHGQGYIYLLPTAF